MYQQIAQKQMKDENQIDTGDSSQKLMEKKIAQMYGNKGINDEENYENTMENKKDEHTMNT